MNVRHELSSTQYTPKNDGASASSNEQVYSMTVTPAQERFWTLDAMQPGNPALNMPLMWQCNGDLHLDVLAKAYQAVVDRHESLRTTFSVVDGHLREMVHEQMHVEIPSVDLSALPVDQRRLSADILTREHAALRFDLSVGPLIALKVLRLGARDHLLLVTMHHIICDGISNGILMRDLFEIYQAELNGTTPSLPILPIQYADYAVWHEQWSQGLEPKQSIDFWRSRLGTAFTPLRLPADQTDVSELPEYLRESTGAIETQLVPADSVARARAFCYAEGVTQNVFFFASFLAWLGRITGESDLMVGYPVANRTEDTQELIGLFINIQPLRVQLKPETTFRELLRFVERWMIEASEHQTLSFEQLAQDPDFGDSKNALQIPIFFLYQPSFMQVLRIDTAGRSLQVIPLRSESPGAIFDIMMAVVDRLEEGPRLQLEYNPQQYRAHTVRRNLQALVTVIDAALEDPSRNVLSMPTVSRHERERQLARLSGPSIDFGPFISVPERVLNMAASEPHRVVIEHAGSTMTYLQLVTRASAIAPPLVSRRPAAR